MKTLIIFLLGLIIGGVAMLFLPDTRRDEFKAEIHTQTGLSRPTYSNLATNLKAQSSRRQRTTLPARRQV